MLKKLLSFFRQKRRVIVQVIHRDPCRISAKEWRSDDYLVRQANSFLGDPKFRMMLDVMEREHPAGFVLPENVTSLEQRAIWQARCEGYTMYGANLLSLGVKNSTIVLPEPTFSPEEREEREE